MEDFVMLTVFFPRLKHFTGKADQANWDHNQLSFPPCGLPVLLPGRVAMALILAMTWT